MPDRWKLSPAERAARRERVRRRAAARVDQPDPRHATGTVHTLNLHGRSYSLWAWPGKVAKCMQAGEPYEAPLLEHIRTEAFAGTAVDVGANLGNHTVWMAVMCGMDVVAFEPNWPYALRRNVQLNRLADRVRVEPVALGDAVATATHVPTRRWGQLAVGPGRVPVRRLDDYNLTDVAVLKIDVEGMEPAVLRGGEATIRRDRPVIFAEAWGPPERAAVAAVLEPWGYRWVRRFTSAVDRWDPAR